MLYTQPDSYFQCVSLEMTTDVRDMNDLPTIRTITMERRTPSQVGSHECEVRTIVERGADTQEPYLEFDNGDEVDWESDWAEATYQFANAWCLLHKFDHYQVGHLHCNGREWRNDEDGWRWEQMHPEHDVEFPVKSCGV